MSHKIYINGKIVPEGEALISVFDRSYLYGEGVFETMRAYNGRPAFCDMHYHRLKANCEKLKIELPVDEYAFERDVVKTINANKVKDAVVRVTISPVGLSIGLARPPRLSTNFVIIVRKFKGHPEEVYRRGAKVILVESVFADDPDMAEIKSTNYLTKMIARLEVTGKKADEGLLQNRGGFILEGTATNLFIVKDGCLFTPPLSDGCLPGITRWVLMGIAEKLKIKCVEKSVRLEDLQKADEVFLTGSTSEIMPAREIVGVLKKAAPGKITSRLMRTYKEMIIGQGRS